MAKKQKKSDAIPKPIDARADFDALMAKFSPTNGAGFFLFETDTVDGAGERRWQFCSKGDAGRLTLMLAHAMGLAVASHERAIAERMRFGGRRT